MKFYLSGGMEYKSNLGIGWREWITTQLQQLDHDGVDPVKLESPDENGDPVQDRLTDLKLAGELDKVRKIVRRSLFRKDMYAIQLSDAIVILYDESVQRGAGTLSEGWESFREGRPIYIVTDFPLNKIPTWLIGESTQIFGDFEDFLSYVTDHGRIVKDIEKAKEARDMVLEGVYTQGVPLYWKT